MADTRLILHVKGTAEDTTMLPKQVVRAAISQGQITHSQLIWSPVDNAWKQVRELPHLLPSQKLAPAPQPRVPTGPMPKIVATPQGHATGPVPRIAGKASAGTPVARAAVPVARQSSDSLVVKEEGDSHPLKWFCIVLGVAILGVIGANYALVERPLVANLSQTPFAKVMVYAHLGAFVQPNVVLIHIPSSSAVTSANLTDFLVALARSTPNSPMKDELYTRVALTSGWTASYTVTGYAWKQLGDMDKDDEAQRKEFLLDQLGDSVGEPLASGQSGSDETARQAARDKAWQKFAAEFTHS